MLAKHSSNTIHVQHAFTVTTFLALYPHAQSAPRIL